MMHSYFQHFILQNYTENCITVYIAPIAPNTCLSNKVLYEVLVPQKHLVRAEF